MAPDDPFFSVTSRNRPPRPPTRLFPFVGGPYDGETMPVEVDDQGVPVETHQVEEMTSPNLAINPTRGHQADRLITVYDRAERIGEDGIGYEFRFRDQVRIDLNRRRMAS